MESTNPILSQGVVGTERNWKMQVPLANRQKVATKIGEWLIKKRFLHPQEALRAQYMASKFEEKDDYRRMISIKLKQQEKAQWQQSLTSSAPGRPYIVDSSLHQAASSPPRYHGHLRPSDIEPAFQKQPSSVVMSPLQHQQNPTAINSQLNVEQKANPYLLSQHMLYGFDSHSGTNMHHLGQTFSTSAFNIQYSNSGMQRLGLQTGSELSNTSQMCMPLQKNSIQEMEEGVSKICNFVADDWKEELYNKITKLKDSFLTPLIEQQETVAKMAQKMDSISHQRSSRKYVKLQKLFCTHNKVISFLNCSKDNMSEEVRRYFPECEKLIFFLLRVKRQGQISSPQQKKFTTSDAPKMPVLDVEGNDNLRQILATDLFEPRLSEEPIQRLIKAVKSMSPNTFRDSVSDIKSVLRMVDLCNGSLTTATSFDSGKKRDATKRNKYATPISYKRPRIEVNVLVNRNLLDEITEINLKLIETVVEISQNDVIFATEESFTDRRDEGTVVRCCYNPVGTSPHLNSELASFMGSPIMPLKLFVPTSYPANSPVLMDKLPSETSMDCEDLSSKAKLNLILNFQTLRQPMSLTDIARTWTTCARAVIVEFAQKLGGGDFSSTIGPWSAPLPI